MKPHTVAGKKQIPLGPFERWNKPTPPPDDKLWHYTNAKGLFGIVKNGNIWATHYSFTNDATEINNASDLISDELSKAADKDRRLEALLDKYKGIRDANRYISSFSEEGDLLSQWREYGDNGNGFCLGFDRPKLNLPKKTRVRPVLYQDDDVRKFIKYALDSHIRNLDKQNDFNRKSGQKPAMARDAIIGVMSAWSTEWMLMNMTGHKKHSAFTAEREWRMVVDERDKMKELYRSSGASIVPFVELRLWEKPEDCPITTIRVGSRQNFARTEPTLKRFLHQVLPGVNIEILQSESPIQVLP